MSIEVDKTGRMVGFYGHNVSYPDWYTAFAVSGERLTVGDMPSCAGKGHYQWRLVGRTLTIKTVADACKDRIAVFAGTWRKK